MTMNLYTHHPNRGLPYSVITTDDGPRPRSGVLFLHGLRERGTDGVAPTKVGLGPAVQAAEEDWPAIIVILRGTGTGGEGRAGGEVNER